MPLTEAAATPLEEACRKSLLSVLDAFVGGLRGRAATAPLTPAEIESLYALFRRSDAMGAAIHLCERRIVIEREAEAQKDAFGRMLVRPFSELLESGMPRGRLRSFFEAVRTMIGDDAVAQAEADCSAAVARLQQERGHKFAWVDLYNDAEAVAAIDRVRCQIAKPFSASFANRLEWFVTVLNHDIRSLSVGSNSFVQLDHEELGQVTQAVADRMLQLLFADMSKDVMSEERRKAIQARLGKRALLVLDEMCATLASPTRLVAA